MFENNEDLRERLEMISRMFGDTYNEALEF
jgi:hypothetical protein